MSWSWRRAAAGRRGGERAGEGASLGALVVQCSFGALGALGCSAGEGPGGIGLRLAGGLDGRDLAGRLLAGLLRGLLARAAGGGQSGGRVPGVLPGDGDDGVAFAGGRIASCGRLRGVALGCPGAGQGRGELGCRGRGLLFQLAGALCCRLRTGLGLCPGGVGRVGGFPRRGGGLGGLGGLRGHGGRVRLGAAAGGLGLGQHRGDAPGIGGGDLR